MAVIKARSSDIDMLARLLRAEAEGEGEMGMLLVGNVGVNRIRANCSDFKGLRTIPQMINQPHAFEALQHGQYYQKARDRERRLAQRAVDGERHWPGKFSLWYFRPGTAANPKPCPETWYNQPHAGRWKLHCFYEPTAQECQNVYNTF
ncbi:MULTISPECIES: cell wall hydrolase [Paenibacillus]|uniref:Cell wall hydrolase n=1 Tax=Paenibacillus whitsoniae TaxID=2496558 RepID=A0A430J4I5_9BACL|nr:cell wall hydrolase [Paenibacillus whitsoniae]RTE01981.1 cell wall hydrolase [Paenibacillus whitsoniae]